MKPRIDMTGWKMWEHGVPDSHIEVICLDEETSRQRHKTYWKGKCNLCGTIKSYEGQNLRTGSTKSCGCLKAKRISVAHKGYSDIDLTGQTCGCLYVKQRVEGRNYRAHTGQEWLCICLLCGKEVTVPANRLITGKTKSCGCLKSYGEYIIGKILIENNIPFIKEMKYDDCLGLHNKQLRYDFFINNCFLLECDGEEHLKITGGWNSPEEFKKRQVHDKIKNEYAQSHNIPLKRIPYRDWNKITLENIMSDKWLI